MDDTATDAHTFTGFSYEPVDASQIPTRTTRSGPGRPAVPNPHEHVMRQLAGSGDALMFRLVHPEGQAWNDSEVAKLVNRQTRLLRAAARSNERAAKVWHEVSGPEIRIYVQDKPHMSRPRKNKASTDNGLADVSISQPFATE